MREFIANLRRLQGWEELFGYWFQFNRNNAPWRAVFGSRYTRFPILTIHGLVWGLRKAWRDTRDDVEFW